MLRPAHAREQFAERIGLGACVLATLLAVCLHVVTLTHSGALWRDEAGGVQLANATGLTVKWRLAHESFPVFFFALVRCWSLLGLGGSDFTLRLLGFIIGLGLLGAMWTNARMMGFRWPVISLALLAVNLTVVRWGDSLRAYGCGSLFVPLMIGLVWQFVRAPGRLTFALASLAAILSVQTLYQNAFLVLAACTAGCAVCVRHRQWKTAALVVVVGLLAAASLTPYVSILKEGQDYLALHRMGLNAEDSWDSLSFAMGSGQDWALGAWFALGALVFVVAWESLREPARDRSIGAGDLPLFGACALVAGGTLFFVFLSLSGLPVQDWYFLVLVVFAGTALDAALGNWLRRFSCWPPVLAAAIACALFLPVLRLAKCRQTNVDLVAAELRQRAKPGDFIVVSPAYCGITFARYFKEPIAWTTLPPVDDHLCHRPDLVKQNISSKPLLDGVLDQAARTLKSGHTLWVIASLSGPEPGETKPRDLPPPPVPGQPFGYAQGILLGFIWDRQMAYFLETRPEAANFVPLSTATAINPLENLPLIEATGWREDTGTRTP